MSDSLRVIAGTLNPSYRGIATVAAKLALASLGGLQPRDRFHDLMNPLLTTDESKLSLWQLAKPEDFHLATPSGQGVRAQVISKRVEGDNVISEIGFSSDFEQRGGVNHILLRIENLLRTDPNTLEKEADELITVFPDLPPGIERVVAQIDAEDRYTKIAPKLGL